MKLLLTGVAGFIGSHLADALLQRGDQVVGLDNFNDYYDPALKKLNLASALSREGFRLVRGDIRDRKLLSELFPRENFDAIIHLAARAGVRPSLQDPLLYQDVNVAGTLSLLEAARFHGVSQVLFASSSSVYGENPRLPWKESDLLVEPISQYGATKLMGEHLCRVYHRTYGLRITAYRFFTVYGPRQRPDMAIHKFTRMIQDDEPLPFYGDGSSIRDYTFIDDIVAGLLLGLDSDIPFAVFNLGGGHSITLSDLVEKIGHLLGKPVLLNRLPYQKGDVPATLADISLAREYLGYSPETPLEEGLRIFVDYFCRREDPPGDR